MRPKLQKDLDERLADSLQGLLKNNGNISKNQFIISHLSVEHLGAVERRHEDWLEENNEDLLMLIKNRNEARNSMMNRNTGSAKAKYREMCRILKNK